VATVAFGPFRLDPDQRLLVRPDAAVQLRPKTLGVLLLLLRRAGAAVPKEEILATVWAGTVVSEYVLTTCISELRAALDDRGKAPRYLRTVHRTGYRLAVEASDPGDAALEPPAPPAMVGRDAELERLRAALQVSRHGRRQVVFVTGEMGIGKTTLLNHFAAGVAASDALLARGQCVERSGAGEPYMPVLEAVGRLGRELYGSEVVAALRGHAPVWLAQIPGFVPPEERAALKRDTPAQTQESMLRQIADAFEVLTRRRPLVLLLEDLHLCDPPTLELVAALALRDGPARLLIVGTFRDAEPFPMSPAFQRLKQQLALHRQCEEIALAPLSQSAVGEYLATRFIGMTLQDDLAATIRGRTEGNPLFVARLVDHLLDADVLEVDAAARAIRLRDGDVARHVPRTLRAMIEQRADALAPDARELLEAASVSGSALRSAAIAAALGRDREVVERQCTDLIRQHGFLVAVAAETATPAALGASYAFSHALYQQVLYERLEITRRQRLHDAIGVALREAWGERAGEVAAELATHFERGALPGNAVEFFHRAAAVATDRGANREAVDHLDRALALVDGGAADRRLDLLMMRGPAVLATSGYASADVDDTYRRALALARAVDDPIRELSCLLALATGEQTRGNLAAGEALAIELVRCGERAGLPAPLLAQLQNPLSQVRMYQGEITDALALADAAVAAMQVFPMPPAPADGRPVLWADPGVMLHCQHGAVSFAAGRFAQAEVAVAHALRIARELRHPFNLASACTFAALHEDTAGRWDAAIAVAQEAIATARAYDFPFWEGIAQIFAGHATACRGDIAEGLALLRDGLARWRGTGARLATSNHLNLLADVCLLGGDLAGARTALAESAAHAARHGERVFLAETYRLQACCEDEVNAAALLERAIDVARAQGARLWELRATLARHRLAPSAESRRALAASCQAFDDEPATRDVAAAHRTLSPA